LSFSIVSGCARIGSTSTRPSVFIPSARPAWTGQLNVARSRLCPARLRRNLGSLTSMWQAASVPERARTTLDLAGYPRGVRSAIGPLLAGPSRATRRRSEREWCVCAGRARETPGTTLHPSAACPGRTRNT